MARPKNIIPKVVLNLWIPVDVRASLDLHLVSTVEGKVPKGGYSEFFTERAKEYLEWTMLPLSPYGMPDGYFIKGPKEMIEKLKERLENDA